MRPILHWLRYRLLCLLENKKLAISESLGMGDPRYQRRIPGWAWLSKRTAHGISKRGFRRDWHLPRRSSWSFTGRSRNCGRPGFASYVSDLGQAPPQNLDNPAHQAYISENKQWLSPFLLETSALSTSHHSAVDSELLASIQGFWVTNYQLRSSRFWPLSMPLPKTFVVGWIPQLRRPLLLLLLPRIRINGAWRRLCQESRE